MSWWTPNAVAYSYGMNGVHVDDSLQAQWVVYYHITFPYDKCYVEYKNVFTKLLCVQSASHGEVW